MRDGSHSDNRGCVAPTTVPLRPQIGLGLSGSGLVVHRTSSGRELVESGLHFAAKFRALLVALYSLAHFGVPAVRLMSNNPEKISALERSGIHVLERVPCIVFTKIGGPVEPDRIAADVGDRFRVG